MRVTGSHYIGYCMRDMRPPHSLCDGHLLVLYILPYDLSYYASLQLSSANEGDFHPIGCDLSLNTDLIG